MDEDENLLYVEKIMTGASNQTEDDRITYISNRIAEVCVMNRAHEGTMEDQHGGLNKKTAMQLSRVRGAVMIALRHVGCPIGDYHAAQSIKFGLVDGVKIYDDTGKFKKIEVTKEIVATYIQEQYPELENLIGPFSDASNENKTSDMYDAVAIVLHHIRKRKIKK